MAQIEWLERYSCNIDTIDEQHTKILRLVNAMDEAATTRDRERVGHILNDLVSTIISHFEFEEDLMGQSGYGHLKAHKRLHDRFVEKLVTFTQRYDNGECVAQEVHAFLHEWFVYHIEDDRDFCLGIAEEMNVTPQKGKGWFSRTFGS